MLSGSLVAQNYNIRPGAIPFFKVNGLNLRIELSAAAKKISRLARKHAL